MTKFSVETMMFPVVLYFCFLGVLLRVLEASVPFEEEITDKRN